MDRERERPWALLAKAEHTVSIPGAMSALLDELRQGVGGVIGTSALFQNLRL
ncbi:hypothetical protein BU23DRAFT_556887, partial [Bimuria novae-zelandiae CBS 107.79]